ncbi:condensation domain-containing protein [Streptomyces sp. NPDC020799]|uniref:phthiocerol/phthiodiolone dimycocerosyl transferase family protein n=1 Tax=unclassified Streptomyces TaxID=2593676 RepID=UPI003410AB92
MHRKLCPAETLYVAQRSRAVLSCTVHGDLDEKLLAAAFDAKVAEHPSLRSRIGQEDDDTYVLRPLDDADLPRLIVRPGGPTALMDEHNTPLPDGGPLVRAVLLRGESDHTVVLSVDHTITDGHSAIALYDAMWRTYAALADGATTAPAAPAYDWPAPATDLLPPSPPEETERYLARRVERTRSHPVTALPYEAAGTQRPAGEHKVAVQRVLLKPEETTTLLRYSKTTGVSVHGLVSAALLKAVRARLGGDGTKALGCMSPVDLRSRVTPPLHREVMVPAVTSCLDVVDVPPGTDPLELGRRITDNLHTAIERREFIHETRILAQVVRNPALLATSVIVTNMGRVPAPPAPRGLELTDVRLIPVRDNYYPQAGRGPVMGCVVSFDGRLAIELPYSTECFAHEQIREIRDGVHTALLAFADEHSETAVTN